MIKAMIVDDEINTRDSLKEFLPWKEMGVDIVETAKNGLAALELAKLIEPDILLTDVRMPKMDGIKLATTIRELYPDCRIIFLSGYADKEYLKQAIHLKAVSYIEKPINLGEIQSVILKAVSQCKDDAQKKVEALKLKISLNESIPLVRQEVTLELIKEHTNVSALINKFSNTFFQLSPNGLYITAYVRMNWRPNLIDETRDTIKQTLLKLFLASDLFSFPSCLAGFDANDNLVLILTENHEPTMPDSDHAFDQLLAKLIEISEDRYDVSIGIGKRIHHLSQISQSYRTAVNASLNQFYLGTNRTINHDFIVGYRFIVDHESYDLFRNYLSSDKKAEALHIIKKLTNDIWLSKDDDLLHIKRIYHHFLLILFEVAKDRGFNYIHGKNDKHDIRNEIETIITLDELSKLILTYISTVFGSMEEIDSVSRRIYEITKYIKENYANQELSTHTIAVYSNFSQTYLCAFFKKNTGKTLNEYITEIRMEKAKELLKDCKLKLYEVANCLGYTDANYFSTLFKRYTGCTPTKFVEKYYL